VVLGDNVATFTTRKDLNATGGPLARGAPAWQGDMDRVWFITGASSGFGRALAEAVLARGDRAVLGARRGTMLKELSDRYPNEALAVTLDVTDALAREAGVRAALDRFGRIDVLANIAGRGSLGAAEEFAPERMELNFFAAAELTHAVLPVLRSQGHGHVLQLTSIGGLAAVGGFGPTAPPSSRLRAGRRRSPTRCVRSASTSPSWSPARSAPSSPGRGTCGPGPASRSTAR
jgi:NAD(P)-dependent dehydrogenase (short-subunit alcohol dehydrogenase family)